MESPPNPSILVILFGLFIFGFMICSFFAWVASITWLRLGGGTLRVEERQPARWGILHLIGIFVLFVFFSNANLILLKAAGLTQWLATQPEENREALENMAHVQAATFAQLLAMAAGTFWIVAQTGCRIGDVGWSTRRFGYDLLVGLAAALLFLPLIQILMATLVFSFKMKYDHPLLDSMEKGPLWLMYGGAVFAAVIVAPITEEFLFRVLLQGLMEANSQKSFSWKTLFWGSSAKERTGESDAIQITAQELHAMQEVNSVQEVIPELSEPKPGETPMQSKRLPIWPVLVSGTLFGLAHFEYGPSWLPLIFMGILLGYLYRCTHRIWPSWVVHFSLNSISMIGFGIQLLSGNKAKMPVAWIEWLIW